MYQEKKKSHFKQKKSPPQGSFAVLPPGLRAVDPLPGYNGTWYVPHAKVSGIFVCLFVFSMASTHIILGACACKGGVHWPLQDAETDPGRPTCLAGLFFTGRTPLRWGGRMVELAPARAFCYCATPSPKPRPREQKRF